MKLGQSQLFTSMRSQLQTLWRKGRTNRLSMPKYSDILIGKEWSCCMESMKAWHFKSTSSKCHNEISLPFPSDRRLSQYLKWSIADVREIFLSECCRHKLYIIFKICGVRTSSYFFIVVPYILITFKILFHQQMHHLLNI